MTVLQQLLKWHYEVLDMYQVMIVEDEVIVREWLKKRVSWEECGFQVCAEAANGQEALEIYRQKHPDVILTDLRMPIMDGIMLIRSIRKLDSRVRIIILTCLDEFALIKQAMELDVTSYILKLTSEPDEIERELLRVRDYLRRIDGKPQVNADSAKAVSNQRMKAALEYLENHYRENISLINVAEHVGVTPNYLGKMFLKCCSCTFTDALNRLRIDEAKRLLNDPACRIYEVAEQTGFLNVTYFFRVFKKYEGCTPTEYRQKGSGI